MTVKELYEVADNFDLEIHVFESGNHRSFEYIPHIHENDYGDRQIHSLQMNEDYEENFLSVWLY